MRKAKLLIAVVLTLVLVLSSTGNVFAGDPKNYGGTFTWATFSDPIDFNPLLSSDSASTDVTQLMFRALYKYNDKLQVVPDIATAMPEISKDGKTMTIKMRKDVKWHDGKPVTSQDMKFSIEFAQDKKTGSPRIASFERIESASCPDDYTLVIKFKQVDSSIMDTLSQKYMIPKHIWEKVDRNKPKESVYNKGQAVGNGPYKLVEWKPTERVVLEAFKDYYLGRPNFDKVVILNSGSQATAMLKVETGEADMVYVPESDIARMKTKTNINMHVLDRPSFDRMIFNMRNPMFSDKKVRQAIAHGLNKQALISGIYKGLASPAEGSYHPKLAGFNPNIKKFDYNIATAKKLLDEAGWKVGADGIREKNGQKFKFTLITNRGNIIREKAIVLIQRQLKVLGIEVETRILEWNTLLNKYYYPLKFDAVFIGWNTNITNDQSALYYSDKVKGFGNQGGFANNRVDEICDAIKSTMDMNEQIKLARELQSIVAEEQPWTHIAYRKDGWAINKRIKNVKMVDILNFNSTIDDWYVGK